MKYSISYEIISNISINSTLNRMNLLDIPEPRYLGSGSCRVLANSKWPANKMHMATSPLHVQTLFGNGNGIHLEFYAAVPEYQGVGHLMNVCTVIVGILQVHRLPHQASPGFAAA